MTDFIRDQNRSFQAIFWRSWSWVIAQMIIFKVDGSKETVVENPLRRH